MVVASGGRQTAGVEGHEESASALRRAWDENASDWVRWARASHDSYWRFHGNRFQELVPAPGRLTVDVGAGEGRVGRELMSSGHRVVALDSSFFLARTAATHDTGQPAIVADAAALPLREECADLVVAFMSLHDVDDLVGAVSEAARLLAPEGRLCVAIVHPLNSAGRFEGEREDRDAPFVVRGSYLASHRYREDADHEGMTMSFNSEHRPLEAYSRALTNAGLDIEVLREVTEDDPGSRWSRIPLFLDLRAVRSSAGSPSPSGRPRR
jgi:SAM-dependent methyltransferase